MRLLQLAKNRQEFFVFGELVLFIAAWVLGVAAAVDDYRDRTNAHARNTVANANAPSTSTYDHGFYDQNRKDRGNQDTMRGGAGQPNFLRQPSDFE